MYMDYDEIFSYLGYILIAILLFLILKTIITPKEPEGFMGFFEGTTESTSNTSSDSDDPAVKKIEQNVKDIQDATNKTLEHMNLVKYRKNWESLIVTVEDRINSVSLQSLAAMASMLKANPTDDKIIKTIAKLNELNKYKTTLKENMVYLDGLK
jgi:hypothetical protein